MNGYTPALRSDAAQHLKSVALQLFAERGVDGVTVRDIAEAAGQRNHAAVGYHFGSKTDLIRELIIDGAAIIDDRRNRWLDEMEAAGGPQTAVAITDLMIRSSIDLAGAGMPDNYNRFVVMLSMSHRAFLMEALGGRWNSGYLRCLDHLRALMPDMPLALKNQRLIFAGALLGGVLSAREAELADTSRQHPTWDTPQPLAHLARSMAAVLMEAPP
jgi:AcrR family transcriptional regulator